MVLADEGAKGDRLPERGEWHAYAYEFKWSERIRVKEPKLFLNTYQDSQFKVVHRENFEDFLLA